MTLPFYDSLTDFVNLLVLASVLSIFCTAVTEIIKNMFADILCRGSSSCMIAISGIVSFLFAVFWRENFAENTIAFSDSLWLGLNLWLGSQGFFVVLEESDGALGKYFRSLSDIKEEILPQVPEEDTVPTPEAADAFCYPVNYIAISEPFSPPGHYGTDFGWNRSFGGPEQSIIASFEGVVDMAGYYEGGAGNMIRIYSDDEENNCRWYAIYKHLSKTDVSKGSKVSLGDIIGNMGSTGDSTGNHLHFDLIKAPYGYEYTQTSQNRAKYSVDPINYLYAYPHQTVGDETDRKYEIKRLVES